MSAPHPKRIVVLGGGFGGLEAVIDLERRLGRRDGVELWLVSENNFFMFTPLLPQVVSSYIEPRHIIQSIRDIRRRRRFRFLRARAVGIDLAHRRLHTSARELAYDYLVLALGSVPNYFGIEGVEHCFPLFTLEDAIVLRDHVLDLFEHADHEPDPARRRHLLRIVVVGGGYTGVETAMELHDLIHRYLVPRCRGLQPGDASLVLLEATQNILVGVDPKLAARARRQMERKGVALRLGARVTRVTSRGVELVGGEKIDAGLVVWTAGVRANPLTELLPAEKNRVGRVLVTPELHLPSHPEVFAIGDNALVDKAPVEHTLQVAPVALKQAELAAENIERALAGRPLKPFEFKLQGMLISLGMNDAVVNFMGLKFSGYFAWLFWNAVHLLKLVGLKKQVQVALDWSLATLFPRDISIIRTPRRCRLCHHGERPHLPDAP
ncbi:MAG TPA: NAD(P)/FAD-dependent oxidoreductase [Candidatus Xenobia bacterium]|nr:NAD(P)/FAD-dependent oxidoreductase [Candidatus Xenobia bacterium]